MNIIQSVPFTQACDLREVRDDTMIVQQVFLTAFPVFVPDLLYDRISGKRDVRRDTYALQLEDI